MKTHKTGKLTSTSGRPAPRHIRQFGHLLLCEPLERRDLLAADTECWVEPPADESLADEADLEGSDISSASAVHAADAGSTIETAFDAGMLDGSLSLSGSVGRWWDPSDVVKFTITAQADVTIGLSGLRSDIDLYLYDAGGQRIGLSNKSRTSSESISQTLEAGDYCVLVAPWRTASSTYVLSLNATLTTPPTETVPSEPTTPTEPTQPSDPITPSDPTSPVTAFPNVAYYGGSNDWNLNAINAPEVWAQGYTGSGVTVAVVDTGVDLDHSDLINQIWVNAGEIAGNGIDDDHNGYVDDINGWDFVSYDNRPDDVNGHGTHVAGTIAADTNGAGATGVAPDAAIMPVRVLDSNGSGTLSAVAAGIRYAAANGADVINLSLGGAFSSVIQSALQYAQQLGVLIVAAAGNEYASTPSYPARFSASLNNVISTGAHNSSNRIASFSNDVGGSGAVQVDAPGVSVHSTYVGNRYATLSGTSMATPHVAGLAALALSANQSLTATELRNVTVAGANRTISGSDSEGGIDAALTVALAAAGEVSASVSNSAAVQTPTTVASTTRFRRFALDDDAIRSSLPAEEAATAQSTRQNAVAANNISVPINTSNWLASAIDQAIVSLEYANDDDDAADHVFCDVAAELATGSLVENATLAAWESLSAELAAWSFRGNGNWQAA